MLRLLLLLLVLALRVPKPACLLSLLDMMMQYIVHKKGKSIISKDGILLGCTLHKEVEQHYTDLPGTSTHA